MKKSLGLIVSVSLGLLAMAGSASAQLPPQPPQIVDIGYSGTGCPQNSVDISVSPDGQRVFAGFDTYVAQTTSFGPSIARKNCQLRLSIQSPPGWQFSIFSVDYRGAAILEAGVTGQNTSTYFFAGVPPIGDSKAVTVVKGPYNGDYARRDNVGLETFSPCRSTFNDLIVNNDVRVVGREGLMTVDSITGSLQIIYNLRWRRCPR